MAVQPRPTFTQSLVTNLRMFCLIWGDSGCGKTTLAATAPGEKAFVQFDPQGTASISHRTDVHLLDLSGYGANSCMIEFNNQDPFGMKKWIADRPNVETVVLDSATTLAYIALQYAVTKAGGSSNVDQPGQNGYTYRNNVMRRVVVFMMQMCAEMNKHLVVLTHEGAPERDTNGATKSITMYLSKNLANDVALRFNEVWHMRDSGEERLIFTRPWGVYAPMKSRMFNSGNANRFTWRYDAIALKGEGIRDWHEQWVTANGQKLPLPK